MDPIDNVDTINLDDDLEAPEIDNSPNPVDLLARIRSETGEKYTGTKRRIGPITHPAEVDIWSLDSHTKRAIRKSERLANISLRKEILDSQTQQNLKNFASAPSSSTSSKQSLNIVEPELSFEDIGISYYSDSPKVADKTERSPRLSLASERYIRHLQQQGYKINERDNFPDFSLKINQSKSLTALNAPTNNSAQGTSNQTQSASALNNLSPQDLESPLGTSLSKLNKTTQSSLTLNNPQPEETNNFSNNPQTQRNTDNTTDLFNITLSNLSNYKEDNLKKSPRKSIAAVTIDSFAKGLKNIQKRLGPNPKKTSQRPNISDNPIRPFIPLEPIKASPSNSEKTFPSNEDLALLDEATGGADPSEIPEQQTLNKTKHSEETNQLPFEDSLYELLDFINKLTGKKRSAQEQDLLLDHLQKTFPDQFPPIDAESPVLTDKEFFGDSVNRAQNRQNILTPNDHQTFTVPEIPRSTSLPKPLQSVTRKPLRTILSRPRESSIAKNNDLHVQYNLAQCQQNSDRTNVPIGRRHLAGNPGQANASGTTTNSSGTNSYNWPNPSHQAVENPRHNANFSIYQSDDNAGNNQAGSNNENRGTYRPNPNSLFAYPNPAMADPMKTIKTSVGLIPQSGQDRASFIRFLARADKEYQAIRALLNQVAGGEDLFVRMLTAKLEGPLSDHINISMPDNYAAFRALLITHTTHVRPYEIIESEIKGATQLPTETAIGFVSRLQSLKKEYEWSLQLTDMTPIQQNEKIAQFERKILKATADGIEDKNLGFHIRQNPPATIERLKQILQNEREHELNTRYNRETFSKHTKNVFACNAIATEPAVTISENKIVDYINTAVANLMSDKTPKPKTIPNVLWVGETDDEVYGEQCFYAEQAAGQRQNPGNANYSQPRPQNIANFQANAIQGSRPFNQNNQLPFQNYRNPSGPFMNYAQNFGGSNRNFNNPPRNFGYNGNNQWNRNATRYAPPNPRYSNNAQSFTNQNFARPNTSWSNNYAPRNNVRPAFENGNNYQPRNFGYAQQGFGSSTRPQQNTMGQNPGRSATMYQQPVPQQNNETKNFLGGSNQSDPNNRPRFY